MNPFQASFAFLFALFLFHGYDPPAATPDDLENPKVMRVLERLATEGRNRPLPISRLVVTNNKNQIVELKLREANLKKGDLEVFAELEKLEKLDLSRSNITDDQMRSLSGFETLKELNLSSTSITGKGLSHLRMMVQLEYLELGRTKIDNDSLETCKTLKNLHRLGLRGTKVYGIGLRSVQNLKKLHCIDLGDTESADDTIYFLVEMPSLNTVLLDQTKVTAKGMAMLGDIPRLHWIDSEEGTVKEWLKRVKAKDYVLAGLLSPVGLKIPPTGNYSKASVTRIKRDVKDRINRRHRFRIEFLWEVEGRKPTRLFSELAVDRGTVKIMEMGIAE